MGLHLPDDEEKNKESLHKRLTLQKIPLYELIKLLEHLYNSGIDFVDVTGVAKTQTEQDELMIGVRQGYLNYKEIERFKKGFDSEEEEDEEEDEEVPPLLLSKAPKIDNKLTDEDINNYS